MTKRQKRMAVVEWLSGLVGLMGLASLGYRHDRIIVRRKRARPGYQDSISRTASRRHGFLHGEDRGHDALGPMWQRDLDSRSNEPGPGRCRRASERITPHTGSENSAEEEALSIRRIAVLPDGVVGRRLTGCHCDGSWSSFWVFGCSVVRLFGCSVRWFLVLGSWFSRRRQAFLLAFTIWHRSPSSSSVWKLESAA